MLARPNLIHMRHIIVAAVVAVTILFTGSHLSAQIVIGNPVVGGVEISPAGVVNNQSVKIDDEVLRQIQNGLKNVDTDITKSGLRAISLRALNEQLVKYQNAGQPLPAAVNYMAGLQRIEFVMLTDNDVILAGPAEGLTTNKNGNVVGSKSGLPAINVQDFLVAMQQVDAARTGHGISVSIDPTEEGTRNVAKLMKQITPNSFNSHSAKVLEEACGPQKISLSGVPKDSRFAQILVSADYKMKRLAMGLEQTPEFLPSIMEMAQRRGSAWRQMTPRFWMECNYEPVAVNEDQTIWRISGQGVRAKTEEEILQQDGGRKAKQAKPNKLAKKWAEQMTKQYEQLSQVEPVFRELRNLMDLSVVAAIIAKERLMDKAEISAPAMTGTKTVSLPKWNVPQTVPTQCSFLHMSRSLIVTTSGGVVVNSWAVAGNTTADTKLNRFHNKAMESQSDRWWWNAN